MLVKPKCVLDVSVYFENCKQTSENENKLTPLRLILALQTWNQKCILAELEPFESAYFNLDHPVTLKYFQVDSALL